MFLDESGDHNLLLIDPQYPIFVLGGVIVDEAHAEGELTKRIAEFKRRLFEHDELVLHTADIARNRNGFERLKDPAFRQRFYVELNALMAGLEYQVVACGIHKLDHRDLYGDTAIDPYMMSLNVLVEQFCYEIGNRAGGGRIVTERRDPVLDGQLKLAWRELQTTGTYHVDAKSICRRIASLSIRTKAERLAGLELADLVVSPIGRFLLGKSTKEDFRIIEEKFRRHASGEYRGYGLVELPKRKPAPATQ